MDQNESGKILVRIDPDLEELIPSFLQGRRDDVEKMRAALDKGDFDTVRITGHSMKGSGGGYGFDHITEIGKQIEHFSHEAGVDEIRKWVDELAGYLDRVEVTYE